MFRRRVVSLVIAATLLLSGCFVKSTEDAGLTVFNGNVFIFDETTAKAYLIFCQSLGDATSTDETVIENDNVIIAPPFIAFPVSNVSSFNFSKCKQVFVSDNFNDNFVPLAAELTGKLSCEVDFQNENTEADGTAKLVGPGPTSTTGGSHHKNPSPTSSTVIELFSSNDNLFCFSGPFGLFAPGIGPFSTSPSSASVASEKFNKYAPQIRKFLQNHPGGR